MKTEEREITVRSGTHIWKSHLEYYNDYMVFRGFPFYRITEVDDICYLWELDQENPDSMKYNILKKSRDFEELREEGDKLQDKARKKFYPEIDEKYEFLKRLKRKDI